MVRKPRLFFLFCLVGGVRKAVPKLELRKEGGELTCAGIGGRSAHGAWRRKEGDVERKGSKSAIEKERGSGWSG